MLFSRMSVAARLYLGFGMIVLLLVVLTVIAVVKVDRIDRALRANSEIYSQVQRNAINFRGSAHDRSIAVRDLVFAPTAEQREQEMARIAALSDFMPSLRNPWMPCSSCLASAAKFSPLCRYSAG